MDALPNTCQVTVLGGGAAGMMAAWAAAKSHDVTIIDRNDRLGKKLSITGGGRCNLTYSADVDNLLDNINVNARFLHSAFNAFGSGDTIEFFKKLSVPLKYENNRVYPQSERADDIVQAFEKALKIRNVRVRLNTHIQSAASLMKETDILIIATGGKSYPKTGSTGDGYVFAKEFGHTIIQPRPALAPIYGKFPANSNFNFAKLAGISVKNARITIDKHVQQGDLIFTHHGISGPAAIALSRYVSPDKSVVIDFLPEMADFDAFLIEKFKSQPTRKIVNILVDSLPNLPKNLIAHLLDVAATASNVSKKQRVQIVETLKNFTFKIRKTADFNEAMITAGGVAVNEINPSTMQSKKARDLYFAGEVIDVDGMTGGFNLQIAFSTGFLAGVSIK
ncbi:MAG: NAD(P)/FAD-dependent oxidoreductase [Turicibacter sp.]|nr:NAD(P)/FAD-dependent oxidoreductase [Turicibacter sp.]